MDLRHLSTPALTTAAAGALSACAGFSMTAPENGSVVRLGAQTTFVVVASPSMTGLQVKVDGNDVTNQITDLTDVRAQGQVTLPVGTHGISATATVPCWHCFPQQWKASAESIVCVAPPGSLATPSKTALAKGDNLSWSNFNDKTVGVAADSGMLETRWKLIRKGTGITSTTGLIQSIGTNCLCMRSTDDKQNTPIGLAICDMNDPLQLWQALQLPPFGTSDFQLQNTGRGISDACLTEGANGQLARRACGGTLDQLWSVRDNTTGVVGPPF